MLLYIKLFWCLALFGLHKLLEEYLGMLKWGRLLLGVPPYVWSPPYCILEDSTDVIRTLIESKFCILSRF